MSNAFEQGNLVRVQGVFKDSDSAAVDPTGVTFKYQVAQGTVTTYVYGTDDEIVRSTAGTYYVDLSLAASGWWYYCWAGSGTGQAEQPGRFRVLAHEPCS